MVEVIASIIVAIINIIPAMSKGDSARKKARTKKMINTILTLLFLFVIGYVAMDIIKPGEKSREISSLKAKTDSVIAINKIIDAKYDSMLVINARLINDVKHLNDRIVNFNNEKYPFEFTQQSILEFRSRMTDVMYSLNASKISLFIFHNPSGMGYKMLQIDGGTKSYSSMSAVVSVNNNNMQPVDEKFYQNIPVAQFSNWLNKNGFKQGYIEFNDKNSSNVDKVLARFIMLDPDNTETMYLFNVNNYDNQKQYGKYIGILYVDYGRYQRKMSHDDIQKIKVLCDYTSETLSKSRKKK